jgi:hypothetical protein
MTQLVSIGVYRCLLEVAAMDLSDRPAILRLISEEDFWQVAQREFSNHDLKGSGGTP